MNEAKDNERSARSAARSTLDRILEEVEALEEAQANDDTDAEEEARQEIEEGALEVSVKGAEWHAPGDSCVPTHYRVLLSWGGPAVQVTGTLDRWCQPDTAEIQGQDWGTPWLTIETTSEEDDALLTFAQQFWFGE